MTGPDEPGLTNAFAEYGTYRLLVEELNRGGGPDLKYRVDILPYSPGFTLSVETNRIEAGPGQSFEVKVTAARREYDGPITLKLIGEAQAFAVTNNVIATKTNSIQLHATVPADYVAGRLLSFGIVGEAEVNGASFKTPASTFTCLRHLFPNQLYPPPALDGLISLGVIASRQPSEDAGKTAKTK